MLMDTRPPRGSGGAEPWRDEPNRVAWRDPSTGLQCLVLRGPMGALNGYVRVPRDHVMHGLHARRRKVERLRVHGGITFAGCLGGRRMKRGHWFGFDCAHWRDLVPRMRDALEQFGEQLGSPMAFERDQVYRTVEYVRGECTDLAAQLAQMGKP